MNGWSRVSVVVITRDAERELPAALASVPAAAEIIVADGASRDATVTVARAHGARVIAQDLTAVAAAGGNFDLARNHAASHARRDWIFLLDADERIPPALAAEISESVAGEECAAFDMPRVNLFWGRPVRLLGEDRQLRLVRRGRGRFAGRELHRRMRVDGSIGHLSAPLVHDNVTSWRDVARRFRRDVPIQAAALPAPPRLLETCRIPPRMFRYYYWTNGAWRDGLRGFAASLAYALYEGAIAAVAMRRRRA